MDNELLDDTLKRISDADERLRLLSYDLGLRAISYSSVLSINAGRRLMEAAASLTAGREEAERNLNQLQALLSAYGEKEAALEEADRKAGGISEEIRMLTIRLGAMIYEECSLSLLSRESFRIVYDDIKEDERLRSGGSGKLAKLFSRGQQKMRKMGEEGRFISYASIVLDGSLENELQSGKARETAERIRTLTAEKNALDGKRAEITAELENDRKRYLDALGGGVEAAAEEVDRKRKEEEDAIAEYGCCLYSKGSEWIDKDTPQDILDILAMMLETHGERDRLEAEKAGLEKVAKAEDYRAMIESEEEKIAVLEREKGRIDREIMAIKEEIASLEERIRRLG